MNIIFVCLGNICRSPIAEGVFRQKLKERKLKGNVSSAGTMHWHQGKPPHSSSQQICKNNGVDISHQRSQLFQAEMFQDFDWIIAMDELNKVDLLLLCQNEIDRNKIILFSDVIPNYQPLDVPDPYYGDFSDYELVYKIINELCQAFIEKYFIQ